ncbi:MAG: thiamine phosphate synthase [Deltaproteobacteria bacterium]|nr:thiamine phosphate synthase [Deltaproteobacteria bacterium]
MKPRVRGLYAIIDNTSIPSWSHRDLARLYLEGGAQFLQLRMKEKRDYPDRVIQVIREILPLKKEYSFCFILNDYLDLALEMNLDGFHGGADDPQPPESRCLLRDEKIIGTSSHSIEEACAAEKAGADYVAFGAIFPSPSKGHCHPVQGIEKLRKVVGRLQVPVVAIGGINRDNVKEVLETGVSSIAMIQALTGATDVVNETKFYAGLFS